MEPSTTNSDKKSTNRLELLGRRVALAAAIVGLVVAIGTPIAGIWKYAQDYFDARERDAETAERESRKPWLTRQTELYFEAVTAASGVATLSEGKDRDDAMAAVSRLYWGVLSVVEDTGVEEAMVKWKQAAELESQARKDAKSERRGLTGPLTLEDEERFPKLKKARELLQQATLDLAHCVGASLQVQSGWARRDADVSALKKCPYGPQRNESGQP
ncbi:MAG TPA: hypothetical protein VFA20_17620 [Myxococcaceae bacterium]|nr:hypothetical protein [Myxococcaceae bacterium]